MNHIAASVTALPAPARSAPPVNQPYPMLDRATRRRQLRRRLEPWLLGILGFTITITASLLLEPSEATDQRFAAVAGQFATLLPNS